MAITNPPENTIPYWRNRAIQAARMCELYRKALTRSQAANRALQERISQLQEGERTP